METNNASTHSNPADKPVKNKPTSRPNDPQDRRIADGISGAKQVITSLEDDDEMRAPLTSRGYDDAEVSLGASLQIAAQVTFNARQKAMGEQESAADTLRQRFADARGGYIDFRRIARKKFKAPGDRTKLGLVGSVPKDLKRFLTVATTSYTESGKEPYLAVLTKKGYPAATLANLLTELGTLEKTAPEQKKAASAAQKATKSRDNAYGLLESWMSELRETAKVAFRKSPEQARKLDF